MQSISICFETSIFYHKFLIQSDIKIPLIFCSANATSVAAVTGKPGDPSNNEMRATNDSPDFHMEDLMTQLTALIDSNPSQKAQIEIGKSCFKNNAFFIKCFVLISYFCSNMLFVSYVSC